MSTLDSLTWHPRELRATERWALASVEVLPMKTPKKKLLLGERKKPLGAWRLGKWVGQRNHRSNLVPSSATSSLIPEKGTATWKCQQGNEKDEGCTACSSPSEVWDVGTQAARQMAALGASTFPVPRDSIAASQLGADLGLKICLRDQNVELLSFLSLTERSSWGVSKLPHFGYLWGEEPLSGHSSLPIPEQGASVTVNS